MPKKGERISLEQIARLITTGFADMGKRLDDGFKAIAGRFSKIQGNMGDVKGRLDRIEEKLATGHSEGR